MQGQTTPPGFGVRVTAAGVRSFILDYRLRGRQHRYTIGRHPTWNVVTATREARGLRQRIDRGENPLDARQAPAAPAVLTVADVLDAFLAARGPGFRSRPVYERAFTKHIKPDIGSTPILELRRGAIMAMVDRIAAASGPVQGDNTLAYLRSAVNWYAIGDETFNSPFVRGMMRTRRKDRARKRILEDAEIRALWPHMPPVLRVLLLTAQRRNEVGGMERRELDAGGLWTIPVARYKTKQSHEVPMPAKALAIVQAAPGRPMVFGRVDNWDRLKRRVDTASGVTGWTIHDLRRTARSLMSRVGVRSDTAERVLGHGVKLVEETYDRHLYRAEKLAALESLSNILDTILAAGV